MNLLGLLQTDSRDESEPVSEHNPNLWGEKDGGQVTLNTGSMLCHVQTQSPVTSYKEVDFIKQEKFGSFSHKKRT